VSRSSVAVRRALGRGCLVLAVLGACAAWLGPGSARAAAPPGAADPTPPAQPAAPEPAPLPSAAELEALQASPVPSGAQLEALRAAIERGAFSDAIDRLELWSDQGMLDATLSFDRGVAYLGRAESPAKRATDLGQAVAGFEEALALDPADDEARLALGRIREVLSERRAKDNAGVVARPRLLRAITGLVGENVWAGLAVLGSLLLALGLGGRLFMRELELRLGGSIAAVSGLFFLALGGGLAAAGHHLRQHFAPAVVIVDEARLLDAEGRPVGAGARGPSSLGAAADRVPEGSLVHIAELRGGLVRIEWGDGEAWLNAAQLRRVGGRGGE
jgi:hypothetical protein